jgi:hypothetical protein
MVIQNDSRFDVAAPMTEHFPTLLETYKQIGTKSGTHGIIGSHTRIQLNRLDHCSISCRRTAPKSDRRTGLDPSLMV